MAYSLITHTATDATGSATATTSAIDTTQSGGADLIVIGTFVFDTSVSTAISDSAGNTWTGLNQYKNTNANDNQIQIYYCQHPTKSASHTFSWQGSYPAILVSAWSGSTSSPVDQQAGTNSSPVGSLQVPSVTPGVNNELLVSLGFASNNISSVDSSFTILDNLTYGAGGVADAYLIQTSATAEAPTWTASLTSGMVVCIATFKPSSVTNTDPPYITVFQPTFANFNTIVSV